MIVVVAPSLLEPSASGRLEGPDVRMARAIAEAGSAVELVGRVPETAAADGAVVLLGRAGVGHAALLRVATPVDSTAGAGLEPGDMDLALRYLPDVRVIVAASPLPVALALVVAEAASFHGAALVAVVPDGDAEAAAEAEGYPPEATVVGIEPGDPPISLLAGYAIRLDRGEVPGDAFHAAVADASGEGWA